MLSNPEKIENFQIELDKRKVLWHIGYKKKPAEINGSIKKIISEEMGRVGNIIHPQAVYRIIEYQETNKHPIFKEAKKVALCICTIGSELEEETEKLMIKNELLRALILDALGSEAVEEVALQSDRLLADKARGMNLWPSKRFSPGYKNWKLKEQQFLFGMLPAQEIGVRLNPESWMMIPRKSISFRINFYRNKTLSTRKKFKEGLR